MSPPLEEKGARKSSKTKQLLASLRHMFGRRAFSLDSADPTAPKLGTSAPRLASRFNSLPSDAIHGYSSPSGGRENLQAAWDGFALLAKKIETAVDGTPARAPLAALNAVIDIAKHVTDNMDTLTETLTRLHERAAAFSVAFEKACSEDARASIESFLETLDREAFVLLRIKGKATWRHVLQVSEDAHAINASIERIDDSLKAVQTDMLFRLDRNTSNIAASLERLRLDNWPKSTQARYNAYVDSATLTRGPCTPGTRVNIINRIVDWANDTSPRSPSVYWLNGLAGTGKSTIAYSVCEHFDRSAREKPMARLAATFFCSRQMEETRSPKFIIPTIVYQLARHSSFFARALLQANLDSVDIPSNQMRDLLVNPWSQSASERPTRISPSLVVIDALDENEGGSAFLHSLLKIVSANQLPGLKFLVTSRPDPDITRLCQSFDSEAVCHLHEIDQRDVEGDIARFLSAELPALSDSPELLELSRRAGGLFIYAATAVRLIQPRRDGLSSSEQLQQLRQLLNTWPQRDDTSATGLLVDEVYEQVLSDAFLPWSSEIRRTRLDILHTVLVTAVRITPAIIAELLEVDEETVWKTIESLHAVLYVSQTDSAIYWYHASFPDFILDFERSTFAVVAPPRSKDVAAVFSFSCEQPLHHALLAKYCFRVMKCNLRFNICNLSSSFLLDEEVSGLSATIEHIISPTLQFCCRYWAHHLVLCKQSMCGGTMAALARQLRLFLDEDLLFWIEAMNLLKASGQCSSLLQKGHEWARKVRADPYLIDYISDAGRFCIYFAGSAAASSTPHLYISSLATWDSGSLLSRVWRDRFPGIPLFRRPPRLGSLPLMTKYTQSPVTSVSFSKDGTRIISGSESSSIIVWDATTLDVTSTITGHSGGVSGAAFSSDSTRIVSGSKDKTIRTWESSTGEQQVKLEGHTDHVCCVAFSPDSALIVSGSKDKTVRVWDLSTGLSMHTLTGHGDYVNKVEFSSDSRQIVSCSGDKTVRLWDPYSGHLLHELKGHTDYVRGVAFSPDSTKVVSCSGDRTLRLWDTRTGNELRVLTGHKSWVVCVAFSHDGMRIVSGAADHSVRIWDSRSGKQLHEFNGHTELVKCVAFSPDGRHVVSGSWDRSVRIWDASIPTSGQQANGVDTINNIAYSPDAAKIAFSSPGNTTQICDATTGKTLWIVCCPMDESCYSVKFTWVKSQEALILACFRGRPSIGIFNAVTEQEVCVINHPNSDIYSLDLSRDGARIVSGSGDHLVRLWDLQSGELLLEFRGHLRRIFDVSFSPDGEKIASASRDKTVRVWDSRSGEELCVLGGHTDSVSAVVFSADGTQIVSCSDDVTVRIWDTSSFKETKTIRHFTAYAVACNPHRSQIALGLTNGSIHLLRIDNADVVWDVDQDGWIRSGNGSLNRLMWIPPELLQLLERPYTDLIISPMGSATASFDVACLGSKWFMCYSAE